MSPDPLFGDRLEACFQDRRSRSTTTVRLRRNEMLYRSGEQDNNVYLIVEGRLKAVTLTRGGRGCLLDIYSGKDIVGESCLLGTDRNETATAMVPTTLRRISCRSFLEALTDGGLLEDYLRYLTERLYQQQEVITHLVTADSEQRLAATLLRLAKKLGTQHPGGVRIDQKITQEELSAMVGTTRSRVGYFLKRFKDDELIDNTPDSRLIIDEMKLGRYLEARL